MERITAKEVTSMMQAVAQVYEQPEQLEDNILLEFEDTEDLEAQLKADRDKKRAEAEAAAKAAAKVEDQIYRDGGGDAKVKELQAKGYTLGQARRATMNQGRTNQRKAKPSSQSTTSGMTPAEVKAAQDAANQARRDGKMSDIRGGGGNVTKPADTKPADTKPADTKPADVKPATPQEKAYGSRSSLNKDQQAVNREYDRLRKTDPEAAAAYGKKMAARGAASKNFKLEKPTQAQSNPTAAQKQASVDAAIKSVNTPEKVNRQAPAGTALRAQQDKQAAVKSPAPSTTGATTTRTVKSAASGGIGGYQTPASARPVSAVARSAVARAGATPASTPAARPAAKPVSGIQQRLQAIRDMRAASQERIRQQGGTPATPAVKSTTTTNTRQTVKSGDPMERMTGKGAASLMETYSKVYEEREPQAIDEGIMGALKKVVKIGAAAGGAVAGGKALEKATSSKEPTRDERDAADAKKHLDHYRKTGKMMRSEEKTAADPGMKARMGKEAPKKGGYKLPERTPANAKNVEYYKDDADLFDIIKGHFIEEGLTEEEALAKMLDLTDEERTEIIEGSCGSKKKSKKKGGY